MPYESTITLTLDTICPWTYLGRSRLLKALASITAELSSSSSSSEAPVVFKLHYAPYQLFPASSLSDEDKRAWYLHNKYSSDEDRLRKYEALMAAYFVAEEQTQNSSQSGEEVQASLPFSLEGKIANTLPAHRLLQHVQRLSRDGKIPADATERVLDSLYAQYFALGHHPSATETLVAALKDAGLDSDAALVAFAEEGVDEGSNESWDEVREMVREQAGNGIDAVPWVVIEGKRRDFTVVGCKSVAEYEKALRGVIKEAR